MPEIDHDKIRAKEAAEILGIQVSSVHRLVKLGQLRSFRVPGCQPRFLRTEVVNLAADVYGRSTEGEGR